MSVAAQVSHGPHRVLHVYRRIYVPGPRLAPLLCFPWALPPGLPALASLVQLRTSNTPALPLKEGPDPARFLAMGIYIEKIKVLSVLSLLSLYQEGTVLLTFWRGWLKVAPEIFPKKKKRRVVAQGERMWKIEHFK